MGDVTGALALSTENAVIAGPVSARRQSSRNVAIVAQPPKMQSLLPSCQDRLTEPHYDLSENSVIDPILTGFGYDPDAHHGYTSP